MKPEISISVHDEDRLCWTGGSGKWAIHLKQVYTECGDPVHYDLLLLPEEVVSDEEENAMSTTDIDEDKKQPSGTGKHIYLFLILADVRCHSTMHLFVVVLPCISG